MKVRESMSECRVKTPTIANDNRLVFRQAVHIEGRDQEAEAGVRVGRALAVYNTAAGGAVQSRWPSRDRPEQWGVEVGSVVLGTRSGGGGDSTRIDADTVMV